MTDYEYRVTGCGGGSWRRTEWTDYEGALEDYERAASEWDMVGFERRVPSDDTTIQRTASPEETDWNDVTEDSVHFEDEQVAEA